MTDPALLYIEMCDSLEALLSAIASTCQSHTQSASQRAHDQSASFPERLLTASKLPSDPSIDDTGSAGDHCMPVHAIRTVSTLLPQAITYSWIASLAFEVR